MSGTEKIAGSGASADTADMERDRRQSSSDRRRAARIPFIAAVKQRTTGTPGRAQLGLSLNIGLGGIAVRWAPGESLRPRSLIDLSFELPDGGELVTLTGIVMFSRQYGSFQHSGIRFESITPDVRQRLQAMIGDSDQRVLIAV